MATNNTTVAITISADTQPAETSVKSFKAQLREANGELVSMSEKFGAASTEAINAAKKVAGLKDAIGDAKALAETFNPDKKFVALGGAIQGAVSGFSALQGASALFGSESKDLEKTLLKVQSVMALQQGISGIFGAIDSFKLLANTIKVNVVSAFSTMKTAIATTGLGLLVVAIGAVAAAFSNMADKAEEAAAATEKANKKALEYAEVGLKAEQEFIKQREKLDIAKAKAAGKTEDEIFLIQQKARASNIESLQRSYNEIKDLQSADAIERAALLKQQIKQINNDGQVAELDNQTRLSKIKEDADKKAADKQKEIDDKRLAREKETQDKLKQVQEAGYKAIEEALDMLRKDNRDGELAAAKQDFIRRIAAAQAAGLSILKIREAYQQQTTDINQKNDKDEADNKKAADEEKEKVTQANQQKVLANLSTFNLQVSQANIKAADEQKLIDEEAAKNKEIVLSTVANLGNRFADIVGRQTIAGKALAIASATIDTYQAANSALKANYGPFGPAAAIARFVSVAATIAAGIKNVRTIASTQVPGGGGGGSVPTPSIPTAPVLPQASSTTINQGQVNQIGNVAARAFVVESDVSGQQERIRRLNRAARIS
jgi:hypothetical protein